MSVALVLFCIYNLPFRPHQRLVMNTTEDHEKRCRPSQNLGKSFVLSPTEAITAQNTSVPAFGDNFLARQENHSHYLKSARHLLSRGLGPWLPRLSSSTSTPIPVTCDSPAQKDYPSWLLNWDRGQRKRPGRRLALLLDDRQSCTNRFLLWDTHPALPQ